MIREKIFRLHRHKSSAGLIDASAEKIDFTFSSIQAFQVPKGWDKLSLSLNSSETGKAVRKSGKGLVKNGTCQWTETLSESIWIANFDGSNDPQKYLFKFLVTMGSSRSGVLGEAILDLASFLCSEVPVSVSLPLKKCNFGTTLQVEVKCLTPKTNFRDKKWKSMHEHIGENGHQEDMENKSQVSDCSIVTKSVELGSQETSFSPSHCSFDSTDDSTGRQSFTSQISNLNGSSNAIVRQDSVNESHDSASVCSYSTLDSPKSDRSLQNPTFREIHSRNGREEFRVLSHATALSLQRDSNSSNMFKEFNDGTVEELKAEARMWEQNARKLGVDVETLRKELADQCLNMTTLNVEHAQSRMECQKLSQEIEHLKSLLEEESVKQNGSESIGVLHGKTRPDMWKELEDETRFQKELNQSLSLQLNKTQESNIELISVLQDMEQTIEKQKMEIESLSVLNSKHEDNSATFIADGIPQVNKCNIELEILNLQNDVLYLETTLEDKIFVTEIEQDLKNQLLKEYEVDFIGRLAAKEREIEKLEAALSSALESENLSNTRGCLGLQENFEISMKYTDVSDNKIQEMWLFHPKENQTELMKHLSDLEEENEYLSQRISGLEAQLRYLDEARESSRFELQQREFQVMTLQNEIIRLEEEIESQKLDTSRKFLDMKKMWSEAQEECLCLSKVNVRLQATAESLIEEYASQQKFNGELRQQKLKLQDQCMVLEAQVRRFQDSLCNCSENIGTLYSLIKEENIGKGEIPDSKMESKRRSSGTRAEMQYLSSLDKVEENIERSVRVKKVIRAANEEKVLKLFANIMNNEEKRKAIIDELEFNLKLSEVERLRLAEENSILQMQMEKVPELQNEVLSLRLSLKETKSQYHILETLLDSVSDDYEGLKSERNSMFQQISSLQKTMSETENFQRKNIALEEKILRLEGDLIAREALCSRGSETKNELNQIERANIQFQIKVKNLENVREELQGKVQTLEEELKQTRQAKKECDDSTHVDQTENQALKQQPPQVFNKQDNCCSRSKNPKMDCELRIQVLEEELVKTLEANDMYKLQLQTAQEVDSEKPKSSEISDDSAKNKHKIALLEEELQEIRERYLQISLKYAEVESQREKLLIKLKSLNGLGSFIQR